MKDLKVKLLCLILMCALLVDVTASAEIETIDVSSLIDSCYKFNKKQFTKKAKKIGMVRSSLRSGEGTSVTDGLAGFEYSLNGERFYYESYPTITDESDRIFMSYWGFDVSSKIAVYFRKKTGKFLAMNFNTGGYNSDKPNAKVSNYFWRNTKAVKGYKKASGKYGKACVIKKNSKNKQVLVKYSHATSVTSDYQDFGYAWMTIKDYKELLTCLDTNV